MNRKYEIDPLGLITLSFRQSLKRALFWARLSMWRILCSLPLVTAPAAKAAFYQGIAEGLRDPFEQRINLREVFVRGFFDHLLRSTVVSLINLLALAVLAFGILFWVYQEQFWLNLLAGLGLPFLIYWWMCQPYIFPLLVERSELSAVQVLRAVVKLPAAHPAYSFVLAFSLTWLFALSIPLVGPLSLITIPFLAVFATQAFWAVNGEMIPDLIDPVQYAEFLEKEEQRTAEGSAQEAE